MAWLKGKKEGDECLECLFFRTGCEVRWRKWLDLWGCVRIFQCHVAIYVWFGRNKLVEYELHGIKLGRKTSLERSKLTMLVGWNAECVIEAMAIEAAVVRDCEKFWRNNGNLQAENETGLLVMAWVRCIGAEKSAQNPNGQCYDCQGSRSYHPRLCAYVKGCDYLFGRVWQMPNGSNEKKCADRRLVILYCSLFWCKWSNFA